MAIITGNAGALSIDGTTLAAIRSYSIEMTSDTIETTTMGGADSGRTYTKGLTSFSGTADIYYNEADLAGGVDFDALVQAAVGADAVALIVYPEGSGDQNLSGDVYLTGYTMNASFDGMVEASVSFQGTGQLTYAAS